MLLMVLIDVTIFLFKPFSPECLKLPTLLFQFLVVDAFQDIHDICFRAVEFVMNEGEDKQKSESQGSRDNYISSSLLLKCEYLLFPLINHFSINFTKSDPENIRNSIYPLSFLLTRIQQIVVYLSSKIVHLRLVEPSKLALH